MKRTFTKSKLKDKRPVVIKKRRFVSLRPSNLLKGSMNTGAEIKYNTVSINAEGMDTTGAAVDLTAIAQGDDDDDRDGKTIVLKSVTGKLNFSSTATTGTAQIHRFLVVYDKLGSASGTVPAVTDVLDASTTTDLQKMINRKRFVVLVDELIELGGAVGLANTTGANPLKSFKFYRKLPNLNCQYAVTTANYPFIGGLFALFIGSNAAGVTAGACTGTIRVRFGEN